MDKSLEKFNLLYVIKVKKINKDKKMGKRIYKYPSQDPMVRLEGEMRLRNYSPRTVRSYLYYNKDFLKFIGKSPKKICTSDIREYLEGLVNEGKSVRLAFNALKFYYQEILKRKFFINIKIPKRDQKLPVVLSKDEIYQITNEIKNKKHYLLVLLSYGAGLRVSEVVGLKVEDLDFDRKIIHLKEAKGRKDRITLMPERLIGSIKELVDNNKEGSDYVFARSDGKKLTTRTVQKIFANACRRAGIKKQVNFHCLRHSFATHLLEDGVDVCYVQKLLGHISLKTTQIYTHVDDPSIKNIKSPL